MPKCPKCNKETASLTSTVAGVLTSYINLDSQGDLQYNQISFESDNAWEEYLCPECDEILFTSESEAVDFLNGSKAPKGEIKCLQK